MSNRTIAFIILFFFFGILGGLYVYFFVLNTGSLSLEIRGSTTGTIAEITGEFQNTYTAQCYKGCTFRGIPPTPYTLRVRSEGYDEEIHTLSVRRGETARVRVSLKRTVEIVATESPLRTGSVSGTSVLTSEGVEYIIRTHPSLSITRDNTEGKPAILLTLSTTSRLSDLVINPYSHLVSFRENNTANVYDLQTRILTTLPLPADTRIWGVRHADTQTNIWSIVTDRGMYTYDHDRHTIILHPLYDDMIPLDATHIVALVRPESDAKRRLLGITDTSETAILIEDRETRRRTLIRTTSFDPAYIETWGGQILLITRDGTPYVLRYIRDRRNG